MPFDDSAASASSPDDPRGRRADSPWSMPWQGWREVLSRTWKEASADSIGLIAAGVAFYSFLALVPMLGAVVLTYGLLAEPRTVIRNMEMLTQVLPGEVARLLGEQLLNIVATEGGKKGAGLVMALAVTLFGARNAAGGIIQALNIAYEEEEKRGFLRVNLLALGMTAAVVLVFVAALLSVAVLGYLEHLLPGMDRAAAALFKILSYLALALAAVAVAATLYRFGPSRDEARWVWLTPGSALFAVAWVALTLGFGFYVANFGNYGATYGSLSAVVVLLTWIYLSSYALLFGAELNSELEHQTARDTTEGPERPLGQRRAWAADHVAGGPDDAGPARDVRDGRPRAPLTRGKPADEAAPVGDGSGSARPRRRAWLSSGLARLQQRSIEPSA